MPNYRLTYFNLKGKGEVIRLLFAAANVEYEDVRIERSQWPGSLKESLKVPFEQLPILEVDGAVFCQSLSICRYLAEKYGLAGDSELEKFRSDMIAHCIYDITLAVIKVRFEKNEDVKVDLLTQFIAEQLDVYMVNLTKILEQNNGGNDGFFIGNKISWADLAVFDCLTGRIPTIGVETSSFIERYPKLKSVVEKVKSEPRVAAYLARRPVTLL